MFCVLCSSQEYAHGGKCIVFTQTKRDADNLSSALARKNYKCEPLHGDIAQGQRERTLKRFRDGEINILVATDVAARGLDVPNVDLVVTSLHLNIESFCSADLCCCFGHVKHVK